MKRRCLIESPWYQQRWRDGFALTSDQNTKGHFDTTGPGYRFATAVGGSATGEGGDLIVCGDPKNVNEVESDSVRKASNDWFDVVVAIRVNDPRAAPKVVVIQPLPPAGPRSSPPGAGWMARPATHDWRPLLHLMIPHRKVVHMEDREQRLRDCAHCHRAGRPAAQPN